MNKEKFDKLRNTINTTINVVSESKTSDYATEDVLSNFKRLSSAAKSLNLNVNTPVGYSMFMILMKLDRINNLLSKGATPKNESLLDSFVDLINYAYLSYAITEDNAN